MYSTKPFKKASVLLITGIFSLLVACSSGSDIANQDADFILQAASLYEEFDQDESSSNQKYVGKVLEVLGTVSELKSQPDESITLILETNHLGAVYCNFAPAKGPSLSSIAIGETTKIKGICSGFLMDVMIDQCIITNL